MLTAVLLLVIVGIQSQAGSPPRDSRAATGNAAISGRITEHGAGLPLPRIVVTLTATDRSKPLEAITDAEGRYQFTGLDAGKYVLSAAPEEHRSTYLPHRFGETAPASLFAGPSRPNLELKGGDVRSGVDIALSRALAIEGRVSDPWDEPMAHVEVAVSGADGRIVPARPAYSDDLGVYRVYGLAPGRYRVCTNARGRSDMSAADEARLVRTCHPASVNEREASDVILTSHDVSAVDIRVQRVGSYSISGSVMDAAGAPVDGAGVGAYSLDDSGVSAYAVSQGGAFVLKGLTPGRYIVKASVGGSHRGDPRPPLREPEVGYASADVSVIDTTGIAVTLSKPATVAGKVTFDGTPTPRANALRMVVQTRPSEDRLFRFETRPSFSPVDDQLRFELKGLYRLPLGVGIHGLPDGWVLKFVRHDGRDITHVATDFGSGASPSRLEIVLTNRVAQPSIRVTDDHGVPAMSFHVVAVPADPSRWKLALGGIPGTPTPDGVMKLGAMLPGEYVLAALPAYEFFTLMRDPARLDGLAAIGTRVSLTDSDDRTFELQLSTLPPAR